MYIIVDISKIINNLQIKNENLNTRKIILKNVNEREKTKIMLKREM